MTKQVYTIGYSGRTPQQIQQIAQELDATIFDCRFSPRSRVAHWSGKRLGELLADRYRHVKAFGNRNYKGGPIELVDFEAGQKLVEAHQRPVILMCVCSNYDRCHRKTIAEKLQAEGFQVEEIPAPGNKPSSGSKGPVQLMFTL